MLYYGITGINACRVLLLKLVKKLFSSSRPTCNHDICTILFVRKVVGKHVQIHSD